MRLSVRRKAFDRVLELDPEAGKAWFNRGRAHLQLDDYAAVVVDLSKAMAPAPERPERPYMRGQAMAKQGRHEQAVADFTTTARANADFERAVQLDEKLRDDVERVRN